jgi:hypothetical protein
VPIGTTISFTHESWSRRVSKRSGKAPVISMRSRLWLAARRLNHPGVNCDAEVTRAPAITCSLRSSAPQPSKCVRPRVPKASKAMFSPCQRRCARRRLANALSCGSRSGSWQKGTRSVVALGASTSR